MKPRPIRLLLVDDHSMVRMGFAALLGAEEGFEIAAEAEDAPLVQQAYRLSLPDVVLMDVRMPGGSGLDALGKLLAEFPEARVIMLSTYDLDAPIMEAYERGARGYLLKSVKRDVLIESVREVMRGGTCFPENWAARTGLIGQSLRLTPRELETLDLLRRGLSNRDIGLALGVSENTAKAHVKAIFAKLEVADRAEAVAVAYESGLLQIN
jgi:DNA-binding NarL/FixJ family response regulator